MDLSHADFNKIMRLVEEIEGFLSWQMPSDIPTLNSVYTKINQIYAVLTSYLDQDMESTTAEQLQLFDDGDDLGHDSR